LESVKIPDNVKSVSDNAFQESPKLWNVTHKNIIYSAGIVGKFKDGSDIYNLPKVFYDIVNGREVKISPPINDYDWYVANLGVTSNCQIPPPDINKILANDEILYADEFDNDFDWVEAEQELEHQRIRDAVWVEEEMEKELHGYGWQKWKEEKDGSGMDNWVADDFEIPM
jgi:hypothetical protein